MPKIQQLTHAFCLTAHCQPGKARTDYFCQTSIGFCLECRASGAKTYTFRYQNEYGQLKQRRIAPYGDITFAEAQKIARKWRAEVLTGGDPAAKKAERKAIPIYNDLADQHYDYVKTYSKNPGNIDAVLRVHIRPKWGKKRLDEITTPDVAKWLAELRQSGKAPATVEKIRIVFNRSFELALRWQTPGVKFNPVREVLERRTGVCQDFAHVALACLRWAGLAARYVSGYLETRPPAGQDKLVGADASHAWVSVRQLDGTWLDLDPTNDLVGPTSHVTLAWGRDYTDVAPLTGVIFAGRVTSSMQVAVDLARLPDDPT